ncbi:MAG: SulP family inorganic anion transporter, partial [Pseudolabrys sp.]
FPIDVATVHSRFGAIPGLLSDSEPLLLSAVVADGMTGRRHRSNCELSAQGVANIVSIVFGGITATNVRAGARVPVSDIFHCGYLLIFLLIGAPLAGYVPLAALGAVAWNMAEKKNSGRRFVRRAGTRSCFWLPSC